MKGETDYAHVASRKKTPWKTRFDLSFRLELGVVGPRDVISLSLSLL